MKSIDLVAEFHQTYGCQITDTPSIGHEATNQLRLDLLREELRELEGALVKRDPVAVLDALTDLQYVLDGAYLALGFARAKEAALAEVHRSNMSKLGPDGQPIRRADGKILKGPHFSEPDLKPIVERLGKS